MRLSKTEVWLSTKPLWSASGLPFFLITGKGNETRQKYGTIYADCRTDVEYVKEYLEEYTIHLPMYGKSEFRLVFCGKRDKICKRSVCIHNE